mgnify:CR=1 FL=1
MKKLIKHARVVELPRFNDPRGNLSIADKNNHITFEI